MLPTNVAKIQLEKKPVSRVVHEVQLVDGGRVLEAVLDLLQVVRPSVKTPGPEKAEAAAAESHVAFGHRKNGLVVLRNPAFAVDVPEREHDIQGL